MVADSSDTKGVERGKLSGTGGESGQIGGKVGWVGKAKVLEIGGESVVIL